MTRDSTHAPPTATERDSLAPWTYQSSEFFELEAELFRSQWMLAGHVSELQNKGDYITFDAAGERALIIVDDSDQIRAYHNVCRHRGARLLNDSGNCKHRISCPFHGWSYGLDGSLQNYPLPHTFNNLQAENFSLVPVAVEVWQGLVFVNFSDGPNSLANKLKSIEPEVAPYNIAAMQPLGARYEQLRPYNWKIIHDIDNEGYHVPVGHPSLQQLYGQSYEDRIENGLPISDATINEKPARLWSVRHYQKLLPTFDHLPAHRQKSWWYIGLFPNAVIGLYPEMIEYYMTIPVSTTQTRYIGCAFGLIDDRREVAAVRYLNQRINGITDSEDEQFVNDMQEGMRSSVFPEPTLSSTEHGVRHFHRAIQAVFPVARLRDQPASGTMKSVNETMKAGN
jgi:phenylpropionate dioxygenase-like ring-hydroxylating dioxygenase large terminal subunit